MKHMLELWLGTFVIEGLLYVLWPLRKFRKWSAGILVFAIIVTSLGLWWTLGSVAGAFVTFLSAFRCINLLRILKDRMHEQYLMKATIMTSLRLFIFHPLLLGFLALPFIFRAGYFLSILMFGQFFVAIILFLITLRNLIKLKFKMPTTFLSDRELPTVTVAIPARNETADLENCLRSILANDYPKLEILVLDDCSQDRTAEVIKQFAHDGVRFVQGDQPKDRWLAKNQAYQKLYTEANGELILFCGVDVRLGVHAIRSMVNLMYHRNKSMLSVLPVRTESSPSAAFIQPMRYWWELTLPRRIFNKPPVLSTCWMIGRRDLKNEGSFAAVSHAILPEAYFARQLVKKDQYSFVRSSNELEVRTVKDFAKQSTTAIRTRYPQLRRRPEWVLLLTVTNLLFLILPFVLLIASIAGEPVSLSLAIITCLLLVATHLIIVYTTDPANSLLALLSFPVAAISELIISYISMLQYEFFTISWKDRNICIPVMHIVPHLPSTNKT